RRPGNRPRRWRRHGERAIRLPSSACSPSRSRTPGTGARAWWPRQLPPWLARPLTGRCPNFEIGLADVRREASTRRSVGTIMAGTNVPGQTTDSQPTVSTATIIVTPQHMAVLDPPVEEVMKLLLTDRRSTFVP